MSEDGSDDGSVPGGDGPPDEVVDGTTDPASGVASPVAEPEAEPEPDPAAEADWEPEEADVLRELLVGLVTGIAVWVLGYAVAYLAFADDLRAGPAAVDVDPVDFDVTVEAAGWVFYNAHFVDTNVPTSGPLGPASVDLLAEFGGAAPTLFHLVPVALLVGAGFVAAHASRTVDGPGDGIRAGAMVVTGYLPLSAIGIALFTVSVADGFVRPDPVTAMIFAGLAYPLVLGTAGGLLRVYA